LSKSREIGNILKSFFRECSLNDASSDLMLIDQRNCRGKQLFPKRARLVKDCVKPGAPPDPRVIAAIIIPEHHSLLYDWLIFR
jgi:hypothetical protein